jgi:hypothetical protein
MLAEELEPSSVLAYLPQFDLSRERYLHPLLLSTATINTTAPLQRYKFNVKQMVESKVPNIFLVFNAPNEGRARRKPPKSSNETPHRRPSVEMGLDFRFR